MKAIVLLLGRSCRRSGGMRAAKRLSKFSAGKIYVPEQAVPKINTPGHTLKKAMELTTEEIAQRILKIAEPLLHKAGVELIELKVGRHKGDVLLLVTADRPMGGITMEECSTLNRSLVNAIDEAAFLPEDGYSLEFSSPGLDRPLKTYKDFLRNLNCDIRFTFNEAVSGKKELNALLMAATPENLTIYTQKKEEIVVPIANIHKGMLII